MAKAPKKYVQLAELPGTEGWKTFDGKVVPFSALSERELTDALQRSEAKQLHYFNKSDLFARLVEKIEEEADRRGIELVHLDSEFSLKNAEARKKSKET